jgi:hypothetical protein
MKLSLLDKSIVVQVVNSPTLLNQKFHYCIQNSSALIHFLSQINPIHILTSVLVNPVLTLPFQLLVNLNLVSNSSISYH